MMTCYEYPKFELSTFDRWALLVAKRRILRFNSASDEVEEKRPDLFEVLPVWAETTKYKLRKSLGGHISLESWVYANLQPQPMIAYEDCQLPAQVYDRLEWVNVLLKRPRMNCVEKIGTCILSRFG